MNNVKQFRQGVAAIVLNHQNQILICKRVGEKSHFQFPQGGIKKGEDEKNALFRELKEEIGTNDVTIITQLPEKTRYYWPKNERKSSFIGQEHCWFIVKLNSNQELVPSSEFSDFEWINPKNSLSRTFYRRRETYKIVYEMVQKLDLEISRLLS